MPTYPVNDDDVFAVTTRAFLDAQTILNTFHYSAQGPTNDEGVAVAEALGAAFNDAVQSLIASVQSNELVYVSTIVQKIYPARFVISESIANLAPAGGIVEASLPTTVAVVLKRTSFLADRHGRGRIFCAGIPVTQVDASRLTGPGLILWDNVAQSLKEDLLAVEGFTFQPIIFNRVSPEGSFTIAQAVATPRLRVQRRREIGVGF